MASKGMISSTSLADLLRPVSFGLDLVEARIAEVIETSQKSLGDSYRSLFAGGKRLRPAITLLAAGVPACLEREIVALGAALEMLHTATLIHDDIIDCSDMRRGRETIFAAYGEDTAILAGDHLFAQAAVVVTETKDLEALRIFAETLVTISSGELEQIWMRGRLPSLDDYLRLIHAKTACLFESAAFGGALLAGRSREEAGRFANYGRYLGLAFQIADDTLDYVGDTDVMGKPTLSDLQRGLMTLPALLYAWQLPGWEKMQVPRDLSEAEVVRLTQRVVAGGFVEQALEMARDYSRRAQDSIEGLAEGDCAESLRGLAAFAIERAM